MAGLGLPPGIWAPPDEWFTGGAPVNPPVPPPGPAVTAEPGAGAAPVDGGGDPAGVAPAAPMFPPNDWFQPAAADAVAGTLSPAPAPTMIPAAVAAQGPPDIPGGAPPPMAPQAPELPRPGQAPGFGVQLQAPVRPAGVFPDVLFPPPVPAPGDPAAEQAGLEAGRELAAQGPEAVAEQGAIADQREEGFVATRFLEEERKNRQTAEKNLIRWQGEEADLQKERVALRTEAAELAKGGVNNDHWWESRTTGQKIGSYVTAIAGGLLAPYNGGRNSGLDLITGAIERDIESQKANLMHRREVLGQRRGILADLTQANNDHLRSEETMRLAAFENVAQRLQAEAARLDPRGSAAQRIATALQNVRAEQAKLAVAADERLFQRKKDVFDMRIKEEQVREQRRARAEMAAERRARIAQADKSRDAEMYAKGYIPDPGAPGGYKPDPNRPAGEDLDAQVKRANLALAGERTLKVRAERVRQEAQTRAEGSAAGGSPHTFHDQTGQPFRQKDGTLFEVTDDTRKKDIDRLNESAQNVRRLVDLMRGMRENGGGASKWIGSPEYQEAVGLAQILDFDTLKNFGLGAPTGRDVQLVAAARGGKDITSFIYDPGPGLETLATQAQAKLNSKLRTAGYDGPRVEFGSYGPSQASMTPEQGFDFLLAGPSAGTPDDARAEFFKSKKALLNRWVKDSPWVFEDMNAEGIKAHWAADPNLSDKEKTALAADFDKALERVAKKKALEPVKYDYQRQMSRVEQEIDEEDLEDED